MEEGYETASSGGCVFMFRLTSQRVKGEVSERARPLPSARVLVFFLPSSETISVPLLLADFAGTSSPCVFFPSAKRLFYTCTVMRSRPITRARVASSVRGPCAISIYYLALSISEGTRWRDMDG